MLLLYLPYEGLTLYFHWHIQWVNHFRYFSCTFPMRDWHSSLVVISFCIVKSPSSCTFPMRDWHFCGNFYGLSVFLLYLSYEGLTQFAIAYPSISPNAFIVVPSLWGINTVSIYCIKFNFFQIQYVVFIYKALLCLILPPDVPFRFAIIKPIKTCFQC